MAICPISEIIDELRQGRMIVVLDDKDRENEGDVVFAAEFATPQKINFMAKHARGLICMPISETHAKRLNLPPMVARNRSVHGTNFTVSIEAAHGVTTGISAADRAHTIKVACAPEARADDIVQPGHVFPLVAERGGVLMRAGHTEACCDLAQLAGLRPAAVLCEIMNDDGTMARLPELEEFAATHDLKIGTIADLIRYRMENESTIQRAGECAVTSEFGNFWLVAYHDTISEKTHLALVRGEIMSDKPTLVRVHVQESLLDLFTDMHRRGHWTLHAALRRVAAEENGVVVVLDHAESPANLPKRIEHIHNQEVAFEPLVARREREELRTYGLGSQILADVGVRKMRVLGRPMKVPAMSGFGLEIIEYIENKQPVSRDKPAKSASA
jgi:3,4-dihydroxy 2-butanone 4-phosphate synthase/GTP cyclohydrolase II